MTTIEAVSAYLPSAVVPIEEIGAQLAMDPKQVATFRRFYGLSEVRYDPDGDLAQMMINAAGKLTALTGRESQVRYVLQARTLQTVAPYPENPLHQVRTALGLEHAVSFAVTQHACASGLLAVHLAGELLAADGDPDALALVFAGEKAFTPTAQLIPNTTFMGEGSAAVLVGLSGDHDRLLGYATRTYGQFNAGLRMDAARAAEFEAIYQDGLAEVVLAAVEQAGVALSDVHLILPHNVNRLSWVRLCKQIGYPVDRVLLDNVASTGHCFCADSFINYQTALELERLAPGDRYLMVAVGLGATFSAMVFEH
ncbi:3-oxoacyl-[acyl-carrier-protein] synthase III C-terminal domain-containing protein [Micromonospora craniellae]|uniref:3-oxoacyl-ACP synthase n=1 Tax=Micromonospora craniellae TaxID=2294034 RepID=A0A372FV87_9ACTN|nr:3-oxoacyl-[acyl-carrier-protein] synthase III C-terminal domain-containing protein [Micromonospora craniellae]QOC89746.1 3-oxoacyl-ACP synthase [Micromonospora craniellae]RFS44534.1 3-oxoacyl-ACP synthase [Micromonospora craniellae]